MQKVREKKELRRFHKSKFHIQAFFNNQLSEDLSTIYPKNSITAKNTKFGYILQGRKFKTYLKKYFWKWSQYRFH